MGATRMYIAIALLLTTILSAICLVVSDNPDEVTFLPGLNEEVNFKHYSGYLTGRDTDNRLHYWFVESQNNPKNDPLLLWFNGGPGCSSLMGMVSENGPFSVQEDGNTVKLNPYSWNSFSNVIYLESPVGVGFSYNNMTSEYPTGDIKSAEDNYQAIQDFFIKFPQFLQNEFFVSGESYAGIYVTMLVDKILTGNTKINLQGFLLGNSILDWHMNRVSKAFYFFYHAFIDHKTFSRVVNKCCNGSFDLFQCNNQSDECTDEILSLKIDTGFPYNIYQDCPNVWRQDAAYEMKFGTSPCMNGSSYTAYFDQETVRQALHVDKRAPTWRICEDIPFQKEIRSVKDYVTSATRRLRVLIYNGDFDIVCNVLGAEWFTASLGLPLIFEMKPFKVNDLPAGYSTVYENLTFVSIKGAGHMVPFEKPRVILSVVKSFLRNSTL